MGRGQGLFENVQAWGDSILKGKSTEETAERREVRIKKRDKPT